MNIKLNIKTGSLENSGTDADVTIKIYGSKNNTDEIPLNLLKTSNVFEKDNLDSFSFITDNIGDILRIKIWHNNKWLGADWLLEFCSIEILENNKTYYIPVNKWIKGNTKYEFYPVKTVSYIIEITTGTLPASGSNSNLFLSLIGSKKNTYFFNLKPYLKNKKFITGHTDVITIRNVDIGKIKEIKIKSDSSGFNSNVFINRIKIKKDNHKSFVTFPIFIWIKPGNEYSFNPNKIEYTIKISTGNVSAGGTDANVSMILYGTKANSEIIPLNEFISRNAFEAGMIDYLKISLKDLGEIKKIKIWHDEKFLGDGWFLNKINIVNEKTGMDSEFPYYSWLDKSENPNSTIVELKTVPIQARPFYAIAHMVNTPAYVEEALSMGSNAIEFDITPTFENNNFSFNAFHGFRPDFDPDKVNLMERSLAKTKLGIYLNRLQDFEEEYPKFSLAIFDCKLGNIPKNKFKLCGSQLADIVVKEFCNNKTENRIHCIISVGKKRYVAFFDGFFSKIPKEFKKYFGADLSEESFQTTEKVFASRREGNFWWGSGIASQAPKSLRNYVPKFLIAAKKRTVRGIIKRIYYWTLDDSDSMEKMLVTKLDGIIVNNPLILLRVLEKEEFKHSFRLALKNDDPFSLI